MADRDELAHQANLARADREYEAAVAEDRAVERAQEAQELAYTTFAVSPAVFLAMHAELVRLRDDKTLARVRADEREACAAIADKWRDENKAAAARARKQAAYLDSIGGASMADQLDGAAIECNAIAAAIRERNQ